MSQKFVLKVEIRCEKCKQRVMKTAAGMQGVDLVAIDIKKKEITVIGEPDPVCLTNKLRKFGFAELISAGPAKEPGKPPAEKKKDEKAPNPPVTYVHLPSCCERCSRDQGWYIIEYVDK